MSKYFRVIFLMVMVTAAVCLPIYYYSRKVAQGSLMPSSPAVNRELTDDQLAALIRSMPRCDELNEPDELLRSMEIGRAFTGVDVERMIRIYKKLSIGYARAGDMPTLHNKLGTLNLIVFDVPARLAPQLIFSDGQILGSRASPHQDPFSDDQVVMIRFYNAKYGKRKLPN